MFRQKIRRHAGSHRFFAERSQRAERMRKNARRQIEPAMNLDLCSSRLHTVAQQAISD